MKRKFPSGVVCYNSLVLLVLSQLPKRDTRSLYAAVLMSQNILTNNLAKLTLLSFTIFMNFYEKDFGSVDDTVILLISSWSLQMVLLMILMGQTTRNETGFFSIPPGCVYDVFFLVELNLFYTVCPPQSTSLSCASLKRIYVWCIDDIMNLSKFAKFAFMEYV